MKLRTLAATAAVAAVGSALVTAPALADLQLGGSSSTLVRYEALPEAAAATVTSTLTPSGRSTVTLTLTGFPAGRTFGAHAHAKGCDAVVKGGGHWQRVVGPAGDPRYANPGNEMWLDVTTDANGDGSAIATQDFGKSSSTRPMSVIIHADPTGTGSGVAGKAGTKLACVPVGL